MNKPFLKWAGGKIKLLPKLKELGIEQGERYIEPFVGAGSIALNMPHKEIVINDSNKALIDVWLFLKDHNLIELPNDAENVTIRALKQYFLLKYNTEQWYYTWRSEFNRFKNKDNEKLFLYLNRHCFNGLCRFNKKGEFNVPYGRYKKVYFPEKELLAAIEVMKKTRIYNKDFRFIFEELVVGEGDTIFCDPPYSQVSKTSSFTAYDGNEFGATKHIELVECAKHAKERGAVVIITNNDTPFTREIYQSADELHYVDVQKNISCKGKSRTKQKEVIAVYRP